jgi:hypothetical protein
MSINIMPPGAFKPHIQKKLGDQSLAPEEVYPAELRGNMLIEMNK